jgi:bis(5'-nucleosyl)-tetraphosphatase (symmetrical)
VTRYAVGDVQGCYEELRALLARLKFSADRDRLWFVGDLVNRGPRSLDTLRLVRSMGDSAIVVLGNHDLHLLAVAFGARRRRKSDTLDAVLEAEDRDELLEWLITRPLAHWDAARRDLLVHAGLVPQWSAETALDLAREVQTALLTDPRKLFDHMYGDEPSRWSETLTGVERLRFTINVLTRLRVCTAEGKVDLKLKGKPPDTRGDEEPHYRPWFDIEGRRSRNVRIVFGHWSALGLVLAPGVIGLDTGCVWGNALTAYDLDGDVPPVCVPCRGYQSLESD